MLIAPFNNFQHAMQEKAKAQKYKQANQIKCC